jgi:hypothetical protein
MWLRVGRIRIVRFSAARSAMTVMGGHMNNSAVLDLDSCAIRSSHGLEGYSIMMTKVDADLIGRAVHWPGQPTAAA